MNDIQYVKLLPTTNDSDAFLILEDAKEKLADYWHDYMQAIIKISLADRRSKKFKVIGDLLRTSESLNSLNNYGKNLLGIGDEFSVIDITINSSQIKIKALMSYEELIGIFFEEQSIGIKNRFAKKAIIDRFFAFLWSQGKLLYPITKKPVNYMRAHDWKYMIMDNEVSMMLEKQFSDKSITKAKEYQKTLIYSMLVSTTWYSPSSITEYDLKKLECVMENAKGITFRQRHLYTLVFNELRFCLINYGRSDIMKPREKARAKTDYKQERFLHWVDLEKYPNLAGIVFKASKFPVELKKNGLARGTIQGYITYLNNFIKYLIAYYPEDKIDISVVEDMFDPNNEYNLFSVIRTYKEESSAFSELGAIIKFLSHHEMYSNNTRKNTPRSRKKTATLPFRTAMPREMVRHIVDIIKNRPPKTTTKWSKTKCDSSWWSHDVYPVFPMMMLFGYYIPLRGEQVRHLCRESSFIFDDDGKIQTIVVNTDKNVNRKYLQEIPCVWDDLQLFAPFLKWHKEYFKHIPKVVYHEDENSPWEEIEPIFVTPQVLSPLSRHTHFDYHKRVLCKYQLEKIEEAKLTGESYPKVAWMKNGKPFFKDIDELENCSSTRINDVEVLYDLHSLRVTGATRYLESGVGLNLVMQLTGHVTPDTLMRIYINLSLEEKKKKLKSAVQKIYFGDSSELLKSTSDLLKGELVQAFEKDKGSMQRALSDNALFSLHKDTFKESSKMNFASGTDIALQHHPSTWSPMIHGLCPAVTCPQGRENRCSLCPYLITGKLFANGIALKANQALAKFQREAIALKEEETKGYKSQASAQNIELLLEEILGWMDIIKQVENSLNNDEHDRALPVSKRSKSMFGTESLQTELSYLKNAYDAKLIGVEQDRVGLKILTIKAIKYAAQREDIGMLLNITENEEEAIDYLMGYYTGGEISDKVVRDFILELTIS